VPTYVANQKYEAPQKMPGEYRSGATVGTNKMGLTYGDLQPYSKCKIKYPGNWKKVKGHMVYSDKTWCIPTRLDNTVPFLSELNCM